MRPLILLTGSSGQVGYELERLLPSVGEVRAFDREHLDLLKVDDIRRTIRTIRPDLIVNAAAYTAVDKAESDMATARAINADAPRVMAEEARNIGATLVHYSTDYVFDGLKKSPYVEDDPPNPVSVYGAMKLAGEQAIRETGVSHLILRTAWVYSTRGRNFLLTILRLAAQREELRIVQDQIGAPTWCREIARATTSILKSLIARSEGTLALPATSATYHMTASGTTTWHDFAVAIVDEASRASENLSWLASATGAQPLAVRRILPISSEQYPTPARRPPYSVLSNSLLNHTFGISLPDWREQLHSTFVDEAQ
jgi:dTDP-4-dehydrorhamnose reductase